MKKKIIAIFISVIGAISGIGTFAQQPDPWKIATTNISASAYYGVTVANGMIGILSSPEIFRTKEVVLAGAFDQYGRGRVSNFLRSFNLLNINLDVDGLRMDTHLVSNVRQVLNMKTGCFTVSFDFGEKLSIYYSYYALRQLPFTVLMDVNIIPKKDIAVSVSSLMEAPDALRDVQNYFNEIERPHASVHLLTSTARSPTGKLLLCASNAFLFKEPPSEEPAVVHEMWDNNLHLMKFSKKLKAGRSYSFSIAGSSITSAHHTDPLNEAERLTIFACLEGRDRLIKFHEKAWMELWKSDITVEGDAQTQQDIHSMLYHLYAFLREGAAFSPSPMGLSGLGYNGHVFWDTELWMLPPILILHPEMAKSMLEYRYLRLEAAKRNAFSKGFKGAMFPWESAESGAEETPVWALSGPFEQHISACVAIAAWNYYCVTQDKSWLREKGWPILSSTAAFWASRVERNGTGKFDINNVVAADEWAENVDNDAFTNAAAKANLLYAIAAAKLLDEEAPADWQLVADNIPVLKFKDGVTREHAAYNGEGIKQADVNLLAYPLQEITRREDILKDLEYYSKRVPDKGTPAMTQAVFSTLYARLGLGDLAYRWFREAYMPNLLPPFRVIAETKGGINPYFATGAGGVLQSVLMGFGGLAITPTGIQQVSSSLPPNWTKLTISGVGKDQRTITVNAVSHQSAN